MKDILLLVAGLGLVGASFGVHGGPVATLSSAVSVPGLFLLVALLMVPALYVGLAMRGEGEDLVDLLGKARDSLGRVGALGLGLGPALLFLVATSAGPGVELYLGTLVVALAAIAGVWRLRNALGLRPASQGLFAGWALVGLALGYQLLGGAA